MSVRERIYDAKVLWEAGRLEGAVIQVLIAVAATVRKRCPLPMKDREAYKRFILEELEKITYGPKYNVGFFFRGEHGIPIEEIIYHIIRCPLVHEGQLPIDIVFTQPEPGDGMPFGIAPGGVPYDGKIFNHLVLNDTLGFPVGWIWNLIRVVAEAPENKKDFPDETYPIPDGYSVTACFKLTYPDEHPERFPPNSPPRAEKRICKIKSA